MAPVPSLDKQYEPEVDGLRAIAVVSVLLFHAEIHMFSGGLVGVDVFFVISGYLITRNIIAEIAAGRFSFSRLHNGGPAESISLYGPGPFFLLLAAQWRPGRIHIPLWAWPFII